MEDRHFIDATDGGRVDLQAPALHLSALIIACRDGAERYTAPVADKGRPRLDARPISRIDVVRVKLAHVIWLATEHVTALRVEPILQHDRPTFALGYAHSLTHRVPRSEAILVDEENEIVINEQVQFDTGLATIKPVSDPLLDNVATVMKAHPEITKIEVQGRTYQHVGGPLAPPAKRASRDTVAAALDAAEGVGS